MDSSHRTGLSEIQKVIDGGYCIGCGACAVDSASPIRIEKDPFGMFQAVIAKDSTQTEWPNLVCPFADGAQNEDQLAMPLFGQHSPRHDKIGYHTLTAVGYVQEDEFRAKGTSGGLLTWVLVELLHRKLIDKVVHVHPAATDDAHPDPLLFRYAISSCEAEIRNGAKARYYPIEMSGVAKRILEEPGRYAFVGIPCFVKAMRLLMTQDPVLDDRVKFCMGLVCGHLKSENFAKFLAWQSGVHPNDVESIDFRHKVPDRPASDYGVRVAGKDKHGAEQVAIERVYGLRGTDWGMGYFKYKACDYCDDVVGETADLSFGDAWLPGYHEDPRGCNVVVARNRELARILQEASASGRIRLTPITAAKVARSQRAGLRHRREGLAYRLHKCESENIWAPSKRVQPKSFFWNPLFRKEIRQRMQLAQRSHHSFQHALVADSCQRFFDEMKDWEQRYSRIQKVRDFLRLGWLRRFLRPLRRWFRKHP